MKSKWINETPKTLAVIFEEGDELVAGLKEVAAEHNLAGSHFTGIGACEELTVGFLLRDTKEYRWSIFREQMEILSLTGDIAWGERGPVVHAHVVAGRVDGTAHGGHLMHGLVWPTMEVIIVESPAHLQRRFNPEVGLALIDLESSPVLEA